jgi:sigma-B regulation protein RsbU (phosphoserine phosphatase)
LEIVGAADEPGLAERMSLVISELVTNAVVHAGTDLDVRITIDGRGVYLEVTDGASGHPTPVTPPLAATSGRGLVLIDALTDAWGVTDGEGGRGKRVWALVSRT